MEVDARARRKPVLEPVDRASETVFGTLMAVSVTGALSVAAAGREEVRTMVFAALGANLAWGITDAVMYLVGAAVERRRTAMLLRRLREAPDAGAAHRMITDALPDEIGAAMGPAELEGVRTRLVALPDASPHLDAADYAGALGVFALIVLATIAVVVPFLAIADPRLALRVSHAVALATLFIAGCVLGRYAGGSALSYGAAMTAIGVALVAVIIALGG